MLVFHSVALYKAAFFCLSFRGFLLALWCHFKLIYIQNIEIPTHVYCWVWDIPENSALKLSLRKILISTDHSWEVMISKTVVCIYLYLGVCMCYSYCVFLSSASCGICTALHPLGVGSEPSHQRFSWQGITFAILPPITPWCLPRAGWGGTWRFPLFSSSPGWNIAGQVTGREMLRGIWELSCGFGG